MFIYRPWFMVSLYWIYRYIRSLKDLFHHYCYIYRTNYYLIITITPNIMRRIISSPEYNVWLDFLFYKFKHIFESVRWNITFITSPILSLSLWLYWKSIFYSTTKIIITLWISSNCIFKINMRIRNLNRCYNLSLCPFYRFVHIIYKVIVLNISWLICQ